MPDAHVVKPEVPDRLRARTDFVRIQKSGRRFRGQFLVLMLAPGAGKAPPGMPPQKPEPSPPASRRPES